MYYKKSENKKKTVAAAVLLQQYFGLKKKKICSECTTCFCSGCGFGRADAFLIQGYLRETYLPIGGPKLCDFKSIITLKASI